MAEVFCDKDIGKNTCKNASVVDYILSSLCTIKHFSDFKISEFCELFSDAHCPVEFSIKTIRSGKVDKISNNCTKIKSWDETKKESFNLNIDQSKVQCILAKLNSGILIEETINEVMTEMEKIFKDAALTTFGTYKHKAPNNKTNKRWFNNNCRTARQKYHLARNTYACNKNDYNKAELSNASKQYKNTLKRSILNYKREFRKTIRNMRKKSPKDYWKYINSVNKKTADPDVDINLFQNFFKNMNEAEHHETQMPESDFPEILEETYLKGHL